MNRRIHEIIDWVLKINNMGNRLVILIDSDSLCIYDANNYCHRLPIGDFGNIYFNSPNYKQELDQAIEFLKEFAEEN